jgi:tRNA(Ile)-lysidine synthase
MSAHENDLLFRVASYIQTEHLLTPKDVVVVAVSGGPDSITLLELLDQLSVSWQLTLHVAHLNHQLRPNASVDAKFVREKAQKHGHTFHLHTEDVAQRAKTSKQSVEEAARYARRAFLQKIRQQTGAHRIALGHTKSDQAETVLMRLIRGTGLTGLGAIRPLSDDCWIRPLLSITRSEIEAYITDQNLKVRYDETNANPKFLRNRIRADLLPHLQKVYNDKIEDALTRAATVIQHDDAQLEIIAEQAFSQILLYRGNRKIVLDVIRYFGYHISLRRRLIRMALFALQANVQTTRFQAVERILKIAAKAGGRIQIAPEISVHHTNKKFIVSRPTSFFSYRVHPGHDALLTDLNSRLYTRVLTQAQVEFEPVHQTDGSTAYFDLDQLPSQSLYLRSSQPGDWFYPFGMRGKKKVSRLLGDAKIPRILRDEIPLLVSGETILWVVGQRRAQIAPITPCTQRILKAVFSGGVQTVFTQQEKRNS